MTADTLTPAGVRLSAFAAHKAGLCVVPPKQDGSKAPLGEWKEYQSQRPNESVLNSWYSDSRTGIGLVCGAVSGNLEVLDFDDRSTYVAFKERAQASGLGGLVERIESGCLDESPSTGIHWSFYCSEIGGNTKLARRPKLPEEMSDPNDKVKVLIETRGEGGFIITPPSYGDVHPSGRPYRLLRGGFETIATITPEERANLFELARSFDQMPKQTVKVPLPQKSSTSGLRPGDDFNARGDWANVLEPSGWRLVSEHGEEGFWRRPGKDEGISATTNWQGSDLLYVFSTSTLFESERGYSKFAAFTLLEHGGDYTEAAKALTGMGYGEPLETDEYEPITPTTPAQPKWPRPLAPEAFYGMAGDAVKLIAPHTEADPASLLMNFHTMFGNAVGFEPHAIAESARHGGNINIVIVGETSKGRKGSSTGRVQDLFYRVDPEWVDNHIQPGGLSSGEGLIYAVRDPIEKLIRDKQTKEYVKEIIDDGVNDKRFMVVESEFAGTLKVMGREGNSLSSILRQAWDSGKLSSLTKNSPARATGAHISIIGHVSKEELTRYLSESEMAGGFANRFLYCCSTRAQSLPEGGTTPNFGPLIEHLHNALDLGKRTDLVQRDDEARRAWADVYPKLSEGKGGMFGLITNRAEAQVLRLSVIYALLDCSRVIQLPHLLAALAVWQYCEESARYIFGDSTGDPIADRILESLHNSPEGLTRTVIYNLIGHNVKVGRMNAALGLLLSSRRASFRTEGDTGGKPREVWFATQ
jgi:hypothetical protein